MASNKGGRRGALEEARALVALVASLSEAGDSLSVEAVASKLGVSQEHAEKLVGLVLTSAAGGAAQLPLVEEAGGVTLSVSRGMRGRRLRLTLGESAAILAALDRLGIADDDPLRAPIQAALGQASASKDLAERSLGAAGGQELLADKETVLMTCAKAKLRGELLVFEYSGADGTASKRRAVPRAVRTEDGLWYLDAHDLDRGAERTFRVDRMANVELGGRARAAAEDAAGSDAGPAGGSASAVTGGDRTVELIFADPSYLTLLPWHDLETQPADACGRVYATTEWYGSDWLVRMVAACAGTCTTNNAQLNDAVSAYVRSQLNL